MANGAQMVFKECSKECFARNEEHNFLNQNNDFPNKFPTNTINFLKRTEHLNANRDMCRGTAMKRNNFLNREKTSWATS